MPCKEYLEWAEKVKDKPYRIENIDGTEIKIIYGGEQSLIELIEKEFIPIWTAKAIEEINKMID